MTRILSICSLALIATTAHGGLYYSAESYAKLPAQWRGFLFDHRQLRNIGVKPKSEAEASVLRQSYVREASKLEALAKTKKLDADGIADLGAIYVRLGEPARAIELLRSGMKAHPNHFAIAANLGAAWQMLGDLQQAVIALERSVELAPGRLQAFEDAHLKLVRNRLRSKSNDLDDLFGVNFGSGKGSYEPGKWTVLEQKKLPSQAVAIAQQLALWFPADGRLLWQLAELANAHGDIRNAAAMMEGCVVQFGMANPILRKRRQILRAAADALTDVPLGAKSEHPEKHAGTIVFRSRRPMLTKLDAIGLPPINPKGVNLVPWEIFGDTRFEKPFKVTFPQFLRELEGRQVALHGFMYPLRDDPESPAFLFIEAPVGCWYCEVPENTGIVYVQFAQGESTRIQRGLVRVVGRLTLNSTDPEEFLYSVKDARVGTID